MDDVDVMALCYADARHGLGVGLLCEWLLADDLMMLMSLRCFGSKHRMIV